MNIIKIMKMMNIKNIMNVMNNTSSKSKLTPRQWFVQHVRTYLRQCVQARRHGGPKDKQI